MTFKVNDIVYHIKKPNVFGRIEDIEKSGEYYIRWNDTEACSWAHEENLRLKESLKFEGKTAFKIGDKIEDTEFKVNDVVRIIGGKHKHYGTIIQIDKDDNTNGGCVEPKESLIQPISKNIKKRRILKMEKPQTNLEKAACKQAVKEAIKEVTDKKAIEFKELMVEFIATEKNARTVRKIADKLREILGLTDKDIKELFN